MKYNITITEQDYINFNIRHLNSSNLGKRLNKALTVMIIILCILLCIGYFIIASYCDLSIAVPIATTILIVILTPLYIIFVIPKMNKMTAKLSIKLQKTDGKLPYSEHSVVEFGDDMVIDESERAVIRARYEELERVCYYDDAMIMYIDSQRAIIVPYSQLGEDKEKVIAFVKEKTEK